MVKFDLELQEEKKRKEKETSVKHENATKSLGKIHRHTHTQSTLGCALLPRLHIGQYYQM